MLYVEKTIPEHCFELAPNLQQLDKYELGTMNIDPLTALLNPFLYNRPNTHSFTIFEKENNSVVAIWGGMPISLNNPRKATIWFLASDLLYKHQRFFIKGNKRWIKYIESHYDFIFNFIIPEHKRSIKWLKWHKFCFSSKPVLVNGVEMYYFYKHLPKVDIEIQPIMSEIGPKWTTELTLNGQL